MEGSGDQVTCELTLRNVLERVEEVLGRMEAADDGCVEIEFVFNAERQSRVALPPQDLDELLEIIQMNVDKLVD